MDHLNSKLALDSLGLCDKALSAITHISKLNNRFMFNYDSLCKLFLIDLIPNCFHSNKPFLNKYFRYNHELLNLKQYH